MIHSQKLNLPGSLVSSGMATAISAQASDSACIAASDAASVRVKCRRNLLPDAVPAPMTQTAPRDKMVFKTTGNIRNV